jgi:hypothetical protein
MKKLSQAGILLLAIGSVFVFDLQAQVRSFGNTYEGAVLPSSVTYQEILGQQSSVPRLRADGVDEPELGGIDDAEDEEAPIKDGFFLLLSAGTLYLLRKTEINKS